MSVTREELAAFADGELGEPRRSEVEAAVAAEPAMMDEVERHRTLKARLALHFAPILDSPLPQRLTAPLSATASKVVDFGAAKQRRAARGVARWGWILGPALAASLALAVFLPHGSQAPGGYAGPQLTAALDDQLVATQASNAPTRILLSFRNRGGRFCRAFAGQAQSGIACKDDQGWRLRVTEAGAATAPKDYRMASSSAAAIMARAQDVAVGPALDATEEEAARGRDWR